MVDRRIPGQDPADDKPFKCSIPDCPQAAWAPTPPPCPVHGIPMVSAPEEESPGA